MHTCRLLDARLCFHSVPCQVEAHCTAASTGVQWLPCWVVWTTFPSLNGGTGHTEERLPSSRGPI